MTETLLLDANVLIALAFLDHVHHEPATRWFGKLQPCFATCPITQGALVRFTLRNTADGASTARTLLARLEAMEGHQFWADDVSYSSLSWRKVHGHRQVTDAYLVSLAEKNGGRLATLDNALSVVFPEALLVPVS